MQLKVVLPSGEVNVSVEPNSTPGHLKENLKYSLRVPPKQIKLATSDGVVLDDLKPLSAEENGLIDGATVVATADGAPPEEPTQQSTGRVEHQPTVIKKEEEPPKPRKPKKDLVRPVLKDGDVVKEEVLSPGHAPWTAVDSYLEAQSSRRHLAYLKIVSVDEEKSYPEKDDEPMSLCLGDLQCSPAWTAAVLMMEVGERALFRMKTSVVDYDPEGLAPGPTSLSWEIELVRVFEVEDINSDFSQLLHVSSAGSAERAEDLDRVAVHWRVRRWMPEGKFCIASSRERMAILPGYGIVPIEDRNAPPCHVSMGEGQQEAVEIASARMGPGGSAHLYLKAEALPNNRPRGCVIFDVELVGFDLRRGPGSDGWQGWRSLINERENGDQWLEEADGRRKQLETFDMLRKTTSQDEREAISSVSEQVHKCASNASRRYKRTLKWLKMDSDGSNKYKTEIVTVGMQLARATALSHMRFGEEAEKEASQEEKESLTEARDLLKDCLETAGDEESLVYDCLKVSLSLAIQAQEVDEGRNALERLQSMNPDDDDLKNSSARLNRLESAMALKKGAGGVEAVQKDLQAAVEAKDKDAVTSALTELEDLICNEKVKYDVVRTLKVGKDVGNAMKMGDPDLATHARKIVGGIQRLAQKADTGLM